ncbi:cholesterol transporter ABCA5-like [Antedon mediterranea]|uniref:cholesterol transporter ABCA5-like n=1 Tax=Antedon mediterranea TaxID=105859 RepID=UPI003AF8226F
MTRFWTQTRYLVYRNFLTKWRNKRELFQEVFLPMLLLCNLATIRYSTQPDTQPAIPEFQQYDLFSNSFMGPFLQPIGVAPNSPEIEALLTKATELAPYLNFIYYENETQLLKAKEDSNLTGHGIVFADNFLSNLSYTIRTDKNSVPSTADGFTNEGTCRILALDQPPMVNCPATGYLYSGFSALQVILDHAIILMKSNKTVTEVPLPKIFTQMFPKGEYPGSPSALQTTTAVYFVLSYSPFIVALLAKIVNEKEKKLTQSLQMMGMRTGPFWTAWFIVYCIMIAFVSIFGIGFGKAITVFPDGNFFLLWLLLMLYGISTVNLAFMLTPFFNKATAAGAFGGFMVFLMAIIYVPIGLISGIPVAVKWVLSLFSPIAVSLALDMAVLLEIEQDGLTFDSLNDGEFPMYACFIMLSVDALLYFLLAVYFDNVIPSEYGQTKDPFFCFRPSFWSSKEQYRQVRHNSTASVAQNDHEDDVEEVPPDVKGRQCIRVNNIVKEFPGKKKKPPVRAVNGLSLEIYEGQITCLLGHNGAGKTTLVNCLTGMMPSTSGSATIYGYDVTNPLEMDTIRTMTGVCLQEDTLFDYLSPREHLSIYAGLKGVPKEDIEKIVDQILKDVDLHKQGATHAKDLSGGQKRKLCMGIALIGDPKVVILDEPTSGMDPYSRRCIWTLLKNKREGRIILLTTHFMDEADILADRKAIISNGKLRCFGSSLFLKNRFGIGYKLGMVTELSCNHDAVKDLIVSKVSDAKVIRSHGMELTFQLPLKDMNFFTELFKELESKNENGEEKSKMLGIQSYGVSMTTLEEVFLKIGEEADLEKERADGGLVNDGIVADDRSGGHELIGEVHANDTVIDLQEDVVLDSTTLAKHPIKPTFKEQFKTLVWVFRTLVIRNPSTYFVRFIMPNIYMVIGVVMVLVLPSSTNNDQNPVKINLPADLYLQNLTGLPESKTELLYQNSTGHNINDLLSQFDQLNIRSAWTESLDTLMADAPHHQAVNVNNISNSFVVHYNDTAIHSLPILINILMNSLYSMLDISSEDISVSTQDFPSTGSDDYTFNGTVFLAIFFALSLNLIPPYFAVDKVKERELKIRSQIRVSGITVNTYWFAWLAVDVAFYAIACVIGFIVILAFQVDAFLRAGAIVTFIVLLIVYLPVSTIVAFCVSFLFDSFESCQAVLPSIYSLFPTALAAPVIALDLTGSYSLAGGLHLLFSFIFPPYAIYGGIYYIVRIYEFANITQTTDELNFADYLKFDAYIVPTILILILDFVVLYFFLRWCEIRKTGGDWRDAFFCISAEKKYSKINKDVIPDEDEDIIEERKRVKDILQNDKTSVLVVSDLRREFVKRKDRKSKVADNSNTKVAVRNVSMAVSKGEVLGLLGPNGAGKTSLMNVVTADIEPTKGQVRVGKNDIASSLSEAYQSMGFCPQVNPLWPDLTVREHLMTYGHIKGLCRDDATTISSHYMDGLKITEHADKKTKEISGGTKRKLCFALSMLGNPEIILMDEPSTGMDPSSKRFLWNTIISCFQENRGGVLTTHSMEEADAVCSRVGIMVAGQLECLGTTQHLKDKYGGGYLLEAKLNMSAFVREEGDTTTLLENKLKAFIQHVRTFFPGAEVIECFSERVTIKVPQDEVNSLAKVFEIMQEGKSNFEIEEYSFSQSTLEQVFIEFAKHQDELEVEDEPEVENEIHRSRRVQPKPQRQFSTLSATNTNL